ncbi:MAG TPA: phosphocholine cytidylyltransferase family protein [Kofleriaceae bacterium]|nr:phosphocholine cytidylyltransferase family protein [Kofleriaceae bacterium]
MNANSDEPRHDDELTAVVLAAGVGSRMGSHTADQPKCLLEVAPGHTVLGLQLERLFETGRVARVAVVTGYRHDLIEAYVERHPYRRAIDLEHNPFYDVSNNLHSLWLARRRLAHGGLIVNGDDLFHPALLARALAAPGDVVVTINRKDGYDPDDMKVRLDGDRLRRIGKDLPLAETDGEAIGVIRVSPTGARWIADALDEMVRAGDRKVFYLRAIQRVVDDGLPVHVADITPIPWAEIDEPRDLAAVRARAHDFAPAVRQVA